jgi:hypothetical protein
MKMQIRKALVVFLLALGGCSIQQAKEASSLDDVNLSGKDGACSRQCLDSYSKCASRSGETIAVDVQANLLTACKSSLKACVSTCPNAR